MEVATVYRHALLGVRILHRDRWVHGDLKPDNIGVIGTGKSAKGVLLDIGGCIRLGAGGLVPPTPGIGGTVNYLAPESELEGFDSTADIWALGVIGYELTYGHHPWRLAQNPWREGAKYEKLRPTFNELYEKAINRLKRHSQMARESPSSGYIHRMYTLIMLYLERAPI